MKDGFIKAAAGTIDVVVADVQYNTEQILARMREADAAGVNLLTLPELCLTGYTCGDLFFSDCLLGAVEPALARIVEASKDLYPVTAVGLPLRFGGKLYNCAAVVHAGRLLGVVPKTHLPNYGEFYELRQFSSAKTLEGRTYTLPLCGQSVPFGTELLFCCSGMQDYTFGVELCEDLWVPCPPSTRLCAGGAAIILNLSASDEVIGKAEYRRSLVGATSARLACGYVYCSASPTESTQDMVFSRHHLIAENGTILAENEPFADASLTVSEIDVQRLMHERHRTTSYDSVPGLQPVIFDQPLRDTVLSRRIAPNPFVPPYDEQLRARAEAILRIQSQGLKKAGGAHARENGRARHFRRTGQHAGAAGVRARVRSGRTQPEGDPVRHHAVLRHDEADEVQRGQALRGAWRQRAGGQYHSLRPAAFRGYRP